MLRGHVDTISASGIVGWAADDAYPDKLIDISIYLNERKLAQVVADRPRSDLQALGTYGAGKHGFAYGFSPPLSDSAACHVSVRISETGEPVPGGEVEFVDRAFTQLPISAAPAREPRKVAAPIDSRGLFELFILYDERYGIRELLGRLNLSDQTPQGIYFSVCGELARDSDLTCAWSTYYPREHLLELVTSQKFQEAVVGRYLRSYEEKARVIFVHIPKCAGSDLTRHLKGVYPSLEYTLGDSAWTSPSDLYERLHHLATLSGFYDRIFVSGHVSLGDYLNQGLIRPFDQVFTIVRDPIDIALSHANYVATRLKADRDRGSLGPDSVQWLNRLGIGTDELQRLELDEMAWKVLGDRDIIQPNSMCRWLGGRDAASAMDSIRTAQIEITDTARYNDWLIARWGIVAKTRTNASIQFLAREALPKPVSEELASAFSEDIKLFERIEQAITASGGASVFGHKIRPDA